jgi:hypothetical protein
LQGREMFLRYIGLRLRRVFSNHVPILKVAKVAAYRSL